MIAPTQIRKPENWQDFEKLCKKLWGEEWKCKSSIRRNGRSGQNQSGVDISGIPEGEKDYWGIQCKGKDENLGSELSESEINKELINAKEFSPPLKTLIIATSANKDAKIEKYIREKNIENINKGLFSIEIASWGDIVDLLEEHRETFNWYVNNCQYKDETDVNISFDGESEHVIKPEYIRITKEYYVKPKEETNTLYGQLLKQGMIADLSSSMIDIPKKFDAFNYLNPKRKIDYRWCTVPIRIDNIGSTVIEDYKVEIWLDPEKIEELSDKFRYFNPGPLFDQSAVAIENQNREKQREVFQSDQYCNVLEYRPLKITLVQDDFKRFKIGIKPKDNVEEIKVVWCLKSRNYKKSGELFIKVSPKYEGKVVQIEVETNRETEVEIKPKIEEE